jgi:uncharacterized membrane protein YkvA (DUF1232 family)
MARSESRSSWRAPTPRRVWRHLRDAGAPTWHKVLVLAAFVYVVFPLDAIPDLTPIVGWLDDLGVGTASLVFLSWALGRREKQLAEAKAELTPGTEQKDSVDAERPKTAST